MKIAPLDLTFSGYISKVLAEIPGHQNAIVAFAYCQQCLNGAVCVHEGREFRLEKPIRVSRHFYCDAIHALTCMEPTAPNFHLLSLLYESLAYKANPGASDEETIGPIILKEEDPTSPPKTTE